jgi:carbonic anhydrase
MYGIGLKSAFKTGTDRPFWDVVSALRRALPLVLALAGCSKLLGQKHPPEAPPAPLATPPVAAKEAGHEPAAAAAPSGEEAQAARYGVPFAWEASPNEPLAKARGFLADVLRANQAQVALGRQHFTPFADAQTPRATVLSCADSRVQANAWDLTPENDDFFVRNIGNQVGNALGSVEYGIEHLHTPLLLVVGHTGCGAVKAALEKPDGLSAPIQAELAGLKLPPARKGATAEQIWTEAVIANVNAQVAAATQHFASLVHSGELTVVGVVYDFRNELGKGYGKLQFVIVNTNTEQARIDAFLRAVQSAPVAADGAAKPAGAPQEAMEERVKKILDRAQRALPGPRPIATVTAVDGERTREPQAHGH